MYKIEADRQRWLRGLFFVQVAACLLSVLALLSTIFTWAVGDWYSWADWALMLGAVICLMLLPGQYRLAGMVKALGLLCTLVGLVLYRLLYAYGLQLSSGSYVMAVSWLNRGATVLTLAALILEYLTHGRIDPEGRGKWNLLLCVNLGFSLVSTVAGLFVRRLMENLPQEALLMVSKGWNIGVRSLGMGINMIYLVLLYRLIQNIQKEIEYGGA